MSEAREQTAEAIRPGDWVKFSGVRFATRPAQTKQGFQRQQINKHRIEARLKRSRVNPAYQEVESSGRGLVRHVTREGLATIELAGGRTEIANVECCTKIEEPAWARKRREAREKADQMELF